MSGTYQGEMSKCAIRAIELGSWTYCGKSSQRQEFKEAAWKSVKSLAKELMQNCEILGLSGQNAPKLLGQFWSVEIQASASDSAVCTMGQK